MSGSAYRLELTGITKKYPAVVANRDVRLRLLPGEIHAVLGENGAGKSTLMKMIYGVTHPDAGTMRWEGKPVRIHSPAQARALGIGMVFQHFSLFETLTVAENIALALADAPNPGSLGPRITEVSERYGLPVDPHRLVHALSVGERQRVEIVRCLLQNPKLLIMDEPTSVLTPQAVRKLFDTLRQLAAEGCSILYISHKLDELHELCDTATVLRDGMVSGNCNPKKETPHSMASLMIGRDLPVVDHPPPASLGDVRLTLDELSVASSDPFGTHLDRINLSVRAGEIVGIAGVSGNGQAELLEVLSGEAKVSEAACIRLNDRPVGNLPAGERYKLGLAFIPEERLGRGAVPAMSLAENTVLTTRSVSLVRRGLLRFNAIRAMTCDCITAFNVKSGGPDAAAQSLSGGNLQKFIVGRELRKRPDVLIVAQPTWGVDAGAAAFIRQELIALRDQGTAILLISEEIEELFEVADRLAVIAKGRLSPPVEPAATSIDQIGVWMSGLWDN